VGYIITVDLYLGVMKKGAEKMTDTTIAIAEIITNGFLQAIRNRKKLVESKSLYSENLSDILSFRFKRPKI
jgi:hypothetical protein